MLKKLSDQFEGFDEDNVLVFGEDSEVEDKKNE